MKRIEFKAATTEKELREIRRLNHRTFAEELGQYALEETGELVDRFHASNSYFLAIDGGELVGMIASNSTAPFSIEKRLADPTGSLAPFAAASEIRMLAIREEYRNGVVAGGLFWQVFAHARSSGRTHLLISGITDRAAMYRSLGFRDLGEAVPAGGVSYIPMVLALNDPAVLERAERFAAWWQRRQ